jgi:hypothetical protein
MTVRVGDRIGDYFLAEYDPFSRTETWVKDLGDEWEIHRVQIGVEAAIEPNADFEASTHGQKFGDWVRIASVPNIIVQQAELDDKLAQGDDEALSRFFNDPANRKLRTSRGKV